MSDEQTNDGGQQSDDWRSSLPDDIKSDPSLADIKTIEDLAKTHINAQGMLGNSIRIPGPEAGDAAHKEFYGKLIEKVPGLIPAPDSTDEEAINTLWAKLGKPSELDGYEIPEGIEDVGDFKQMAFDAGLTNRQFQTLAKSINEANQERQNGAAIDYDKEMRELKLEWGVTYEDRMGEVKNILSQTQAPAELQQAFSNNEVGSETLKWLNSVARSLRGEGVNLTKEETSSRITPAEAQARADEIMSDPKSPYWDPMHPRHEEITNKVNEYMRAAVAGAG